MDEEIIKHLSCDPVMKSLLDKFTIKEYWGQQQNPLLDLIEIIVGQQLSIKAAKSIYNRFLAQYTDTPSPEDIVTTPDTKFRQIGFSTAKTRYVKNTAQAVIDQVVSPELFPSMSDAQITEQLIKVKGIGPWSAEMFLIFSLHRPDIFSVGDLGLRTAIEKLYDIDRNDKEAILNLAATWKPFRTHACRLLWMSLEKI